MKFDCGETRRERYDWSTNWHLWFAWYPVKVGSHDCRWLEYVERKGFSFWDEMGWEYRARGEGK